MFISLALNGLRKHSNYVTGFWMVFAGLLLEFHAYLFSLERMSGLDIFPGTKDLLFGELVSVQVARFAGGGMLGALLYQPISFLFSNIGSFMIGVLIILLGAFILSPWDVLDIMEYAKEAWQKGAEKRLEPGRLNVRRRRQNVRLRKNVKQKNVPRPSVWLI